jgi:excisionase family DNA binding protein
MTNTSPVKTGTQQQLSTPVQTWGNHSLLTKRQAADYIGTSRRYVERAIVTGRLRALKPTDLNAFMESGASIGGAE